ncbi:response regulator [Prosthecomicrobium sp. N25]|uniref:response regulator n=1 Tax=Prosthecomicrobium sp. N25 TaxID=3129254 RepID=UPI00307793E8
MKNIQILHVDDQSDIRDIVRLCLGLDPAFEVRSCSSGREALDAVADNTPHLILLDVVMPGLTGPETARRLRDREDTAAVPIAFVTAREDEEETAALIAAGAVAVIRKPFALRDLAPRLRGLVAPGTGPSASCAGP